MDVKMSIYDIMSEVHKHLEDISAGIVFFSSQYIRVLSGI
jgi:hypothetical protein